jgi:hypothetical protein
MNNEQNNNLQKETTFISSWKGQLITTNTSEARQSEMLLFVWQQSQGLAAQFTYPATLLSRQASIAVAWDILIFPCKTHSE